MSKFSPLLLFLTLSACGQVADDGDSGAQDATADATADVLQDVVVDALPDASDAAPDRMTPCGLAPEYGYFACCEAGACRGGCGTIAPDIGACGCDGIMGGCKPPYVCCQHSACQTEEECKAAGGK